MRRRQRYRPEVLRALLADLARQSPHQVAVTGDLTQIALEEEFLEAAAWLALVGPPERVSAVPGNHDAYAPVPSDAGWERWADYLESDAHAHGFRPDAGALFPSVRVRDGLALVGVCTALPTSALDATGTVGADQRERLADTLARLGEESLCRVVLIHHPPLSGVTLKRRSLTDSEELASVLRRHGAELVLHGHLHRTHVASLPGPEGPIPVVGVPSASHAGPAPERCAGYHLYDIARAGGRFEIRARARRWDPATGRFAAVDGGELLPHA